MIAPAIEQHIAEVLEQGCWTPVVTTGIETTADWRADLLAADGSRFTVSFAGEAQGELTWPLNGLHNVYNALSAIAAARHIGIAASAALEALRHFENVKRRMEVIVKRSDLTIYDDFAHHPTAIKTTLDGLRKQVADAKIIAVVEPRSNTMRLGVHTQSLAESLAEADSAIIYQPENLGWDLSQLLQYGSNIRIIDNLDEIIALIKTEIGGECHVVLMSNGSFGGIYRRLQAEI